MNPGDTPPGGLPRPVWPVMDSPAPGNGTRHRGTRRDDTTRYLCAATHMDPDFADNAIREFLIENTRPVPTSPGVDAAAVLGEAVAARTRRKLRDLVLVLLTFGMVFLISLELLAGWIVLGCVVSLPAILRAVKKHGPQGKQLVYAAAGLAVVVVLLYVLMPQLGMSSSYANQLPETTSDFTVVGAFLVAAAMLAVSLADRYVVWRHLNERFWPNRLTRVSPWVGDRAVFQYSPERQLTQLRRYADPRPTMAPSSQRSTGDPVPLVVYRDYSPFVGAGTTNEPWSIAVPLRRAPEIEPTVELSTASLYASIQDEITSLRAASVLAPGRRLDDLNLGELIIVSADELIDHIAEPSAEDFLKEPGVAPFTLVCRERAEALKAAPLEWARYYHCYQVETWDRDLVVSVFVHVAVGQGTLYVEWTPCILPPIRKRYQEIDRMPRSALRPFGRALLDLLALPATAPVRLVRLLSFLRPLPRERGLVIPDMYGSAYSLRELAADRAVHNYFQRADIDRYLKMMESRLVLAVARMMREAGYSAEDFNQQAASVVNNNVRIDGSVDGHVVVGTGNKVDNAAAGTP